MIHVEMGKTLPDSIKKFIGLFRHRLGRQVWPPMFESPQDVWLNRAMKGRYKNHGHKLGPCPFYGEIGLCEKKQAMQFLGRKTIVFGAGLIQKPERNIKGRLNSERHDKKAIF